MIEWVGVFCQVISAYIAVLPVGKNVCIVNYLIAGIQGDGLVFPFDGFQEWESKAICPEFRMIRAFLGK